MPDSAHHPRVEEGFLTSINLNVPPFFTADVGEDVGVLEVVMGEVLVVVPVVLAGAVVVLLVVVTGGVLVVEVLVVVEVD